MEKELDLNIAERIDRAIHSELKKRSKLAVININLVKQSVIDEVVELINKKYEKELQEAGYVLKTGGKKIYLRRLFADERNK